MITRVPEGSRTPTTTQPLERTEQRQLAVLQALGVAGGLLVLLSSGTLLGGTPLAVRPAVSVCYIGMGLVVTSWVLLGRLATPWRNRRLSIRQLHLTLALWAAPFLFTPPLFSRDLYSYLAIGETIVQGIDPYTVGPVSALGATDSIAVLVDTSWSDTPAPYGPAFLLVARAVSALTGHNITAGILVYRLAAVLGVLLIVWGLPRLARICSFDPVTALWLGVLNPLVVFHLIGGAHNEALMLGAMIAGLVVGLERSTALGAVLVTLGCAIKAPAALALVFLVLAVALRAGGRSRDLARTAAFVTPVAAATFLIATVLAGWSWGWIAALNGPGTVTSFLSISTQTGGATNLLLQTFGLVVDPLAVVAWMQKVAVAVAVILVGTLAGRAWRQRLDPVLGLGCAFAAFVLFSPTVQQWYLLWAVLPIAAVAVQTRQRLVTMWLSAIVAMLVTPAGIMTSAAAVIPAVIPVAAAAVAVVLMFKGLDRPWWGRSVQPVPKPR